MSFQGYLKTIKEKTGKGPADFRALAEEKGLTTNGNLNAKAGEITKRLKDDLNLGTGMQWPSMLS